MSRIPTSEDGTSIRDTRKPSQPAINAIEELLWIEHVERLPDLSLMLKEDLAEVDLLMDLVLNEHEDLLCKNDKASIQKLRDDIVRMYAILDAESDRRDTETAFEEETTEEEKTEFGDGEENFETLERTNLNDA